MVVRDNRHSGGKEVAFHVDPIAAEGGDLPYKGTKGISGTGIPYIFRDERTCLQAGF